MEMYNHAQCAEAFLGTLSQEYPNVKGLLKARNYNEAYDALKFIDFSTHYFIAKEGLKVIFRGPTIAAEFELLTRSLEEKDERKIESFARSLETALNQIEMRKKATNSERYCDIP